MSPRPGRIVAEVPSPSPRRVPRVEAIVDPAFLDARARAGEALGVGA
jgi:hypothetical protein